jgi:RNA polymerase sigma-70 factor (ECF subfamily)
MRFTNDFEDTNDLVQDTMVKAFRYASQYVDGSNLKAWMFTIMRNTFINDYKRNSKRRTIMTVTDDLSSMQLFHAASRNHSDEAFKMEDIQKAMAKLKPEIATPFVKYFEGFKYHEIADELQIPIGTVKTRIHQARQILMSNLKMYHQEYKRHSA